MSASPEDGIAGIQADLADRIIPLIDAKPPLPILAKCHLILAKGHVSEARRRIIDFFQEFPNEKDSIRAISEVGGMDSVETLINRVKNKDAKNRDLIAERLGNFRTPECLTCLRELLEDQDRFVRFQAANSLFNVGGQNAALVLCKFISDPDEWISMTILKLLCRLKEYETIPHLIQHFTHDTDIRRKALMVSFMSMFKSVTLVNVFDEGIRSRDARLKANSIEAIGELELPLREIESRITPFLKDPNNRIRANALLILARNKPEDAMAGIIDMVESGDNQLRRSAAYILGQISPENKEEYVRKLVVDQVNDVKKRMILSLRNYPFELARELLETALKDPNKWIRKAAVEVAGFFPEFPGGLIARLLKSETMYPNLVSCMEFFARHPDEEAVRSIRSRIQDPRWQVVAAAVKTLGIIQGLEGVEPLLPQILNAKDPRIITNFAAEVFRMGSLDTFHAILEKAAAVKRPWQNDRFLPALEVCLEQISSVTKIPPALAAVLAGMPAPPPRPVEAPPPRVPSSRPRPAVIDAPEPEAVETSSDEAVAGEGSRSEYPPEFLTGVKFYNLGKYDKAKDNMRVALERSPELAKAHLYLGLMAAEEKRYPEAKESLLIYLETDPGNQKAALLLGKVCKSLRDWPTAVQVFRRLADSTPAPSAKVLLRVHKELGLALIFMKDSEEAIEILARVCNQDPADVEAGFYLATAFYNVGDLGRAGGLLNELLGRVAPDNRLYGMIASLNDKINQSREDNPDRPGDSGDPSADS
jgi:HEAT repeat protein/Tfp pilus assembly protein PilF